MRSLMLVGVDAFIDRLRGFGFTSIDRSADHYGYALALKTGTSKDMRDNWCVGYSERYTVPASLPRPSACSFPYRRQVARGDGV